MLSLSPTRTFSQSQLTLTDFSVPQLALTHLQPLSILHILNLSDSTCTLFSNSLTLARFIYAHTLARFRQNYAIAHSTYTNNLAHTYFHSQRILFDFRLVCAELSPSGAPFRFHGGRGTWVHPPVQPPARPPPTHLPTHPRTHPPTQNDTFSMNRNTAVSVLFVNVMFC